MPETLNGLRYQSLILSGGITYSELETELSGSAVKKANFLNLCQNKRDLKSLISFGYTTIRQSPSALAQVLTRGYVMNNSLISQGLAYSTETYIGLTMPTTLSLRPATNSAIKYSTCFVSRNNYTASPIYEFNFFTNTWFLMTSSGTGSSVSCAFGTLENGYVAGGDGSGSGAYLDDIEKINYPTRAISTLSATLADTRKEPAGVSSDTNGYACGGTDGSRKTEIDGLTFANEAAYNPAAALGTAIQSCAGGESYTKGYLFGGNTGSSVNTTTAMTFSSEAIATLASTLSTARNSMGATQYGAGNYLFGGFGDASRLTRFPHATETMADVNNTLSSYNSSATQTGCQGGGM